MTTGMGGTQLARIDEDRGGDPRICSIPTWTEYGGCSQTDHERAKTNVDSGEVPTSSLHQYITAAASQGEMGAIPKLCSCFSYNKLVGSTTH